MNNQLQTYEGKESHLSTGIGIFDSGAFEQMWRIAGVLAQSNLIPETLRTTGAKDSKKALPLEQVQANCFLITEQAHRWGMSPFAVIGCASVVHGRLMWEGKLVNAVIQAKLGINLSYEYSGSGENRKITVSGTLPGEDKHRTVEGTVAQWKTTGNNSPWSSSLNYDRQLAYRGAREWSRVHAPAVMLGVITDDEAEDFSRPIKNITPRAEIINPFAKQEKLLQTKSEQPEPKQEEVKPTEKAEKQKKEIHERKGILSDVQAKTSKEDKQYWNTFIYFPKSEKTVSFLVFSKSLAKTLMDAGHGANIKFKFTAKEDYFVIQDAQVTPEEVKTQEETLL